MKHKAVALNNPDPESPTMVPVPIMEKIHALHETGLFGATIDEVIVRLICDRLIELSEVGWLEMPGEPRAVLAQADRGAMQ